jgi:hypothetical protein
MAGEEIDPVSGQATDEWGRHSLTDRRAGEVADVTGARTSLGLAIFGTCRNDTALSCVT